MRLPVTYSAAQGSNHLYLDSYKEWLREQNMTANTLRAYHSRIKQFLLFLEYANLNEQTMEDLSHMGEAMGLYLKFLKQSKNAAASLNANVNALNNFSHFLGLKGSELKRERCYHKIAKTLTAQEQKEFLYSVNRQELPRDKALAFVLFYSGLRLGDCARLKIGDIFLGVSNDDAHKGSHGSAHGSSHGSSSATHGSSHGANHASHPDTTIPHIKLSNGAKLPLNKITVVALKQWLAERENMEKAKLQSALWLTKNGQPISISGITFVIKRIGWQARLVVSAEVLRRTWLTNESEHLSKKQLANKYGDYLSAATISRHGVSLPVDSDGSALEH